MPQWCRFSWPNRRLQHKISIKNLSEKLWIYYIGPVGLWLFWLLSYFTIPHSSMFSCLLCIQQLLWFYVSILPCLHFPEESHTFFFAIFLKFLSLFSAIAATIYVHCLLSSKSQPQASHLPSNVLYNATRSVTGTLVLLSLLVTPIPIVRERETKCTLLGNDPVSGQLLHIPYSIGWFTAALLP